MGALDDRLLRGPEGWRHRLALIEAADLSWFAGDRVSPDRVGGWLDVTAAAANLHPITRACMGFHFWSLAGLGQHGDRMAAAVQRNLAWLEERG